MISYNPYLGGLDYIPVSTPMDGYHISFEPSMVYDATAGMFQAEAQDKAQAYMETQYRAAAENMYETGLVANYGV